MILKLLLKLTLLALAIYYIPPFCYEKTKGFTIARTHSNFDYNPDWEIEKEPTEKLDPILSMRFSYLAKGGQAWVFLSEDGQYVLKLLKLHRRRFPSILTRFPLPSSLAQKREQKLTQRTKRLHRDFSSYKLSFEELEQETGLIYVQLNSAETHNHTVRIVDVLNIEHEIDLRSTPFLLQYRATPAYEHIEQLVQEQRLEEAKAALASICQLIESRCKKGIYDEDARIHRNFGFLENRAILLDAGRLRPDANCQLEEVQQKELHKITRSLECYLEGLNTELASHLRSLRED